MVVGPPAGHSLLEVVYHEVVKSLLAKEADVNARDKQGRTALTRATRAGYTEIAQTLIESGAAAESTQ